MNDFIHFPKISIITPSYNQAGFISQTIESVLNQGYPNLEYFVIDGGSTDNTVDILRSYGNKIKWISKHDDGQAEALNKGAQMVSGEIMAFLNSDDYYLPGTLHTVAQTFQETNCQWLVGDYKIIDQTDTPIQGYIVSYKKLLRWFSSYFLLSLTNFIPQPSTFWRADLYRRAGPFDVNLKYTMDYDLWLRFWHIAAPVQLFKTLAAFRIHQTSKGGSQFTMQFKEELSVLQRYNKNPLVYGIHRFSNFLISQIYGVIK